ncbi:DUF6247 family protein [Nocardiopsis chromatogenes]|uniref:DUF6247 family protein n=1 Tax=Nocardiopsis chromatogenes TaxID=280239 RepID=UPI000346B381|nr:DUF6247 family protein [Nocardiopsis chromatogenes]
MATRPLNDPAQIMEMLPERDQAWFLREYREAAHIAADDPHRFDQLQEMLRTWHLRALARNGDGYEESREQARTGDGDFTSLDEIIARRQAM